MYGVGPHFFTNMKRILFLLTLLIASVSVMYAQQMVSGIVLDSKTGEKIPFVNVNYTNGGGTQTDFDGHFTLPFKAGKLRFSVIGYEECGRLSCL